MKIQSYCEHKNKAEELEAVYIEGTPSELKRLARFFEHCANALTDSKDSFGHAHLQDFERGSNPRKPDMVVVKNL